MNLTGTFLCGREAAYHMVKNSVKGLIINISSISLRKVGQNQLFGTKTAVFRWRYLVERTC